MVIMSKEGSVTYHVEMSNGQVRKCHTDQLRLRTVQADRHEPQVSPTLPPTSTTSANVSVPSVPDPPLVELSQEIDSPVVESSSNLDTSSAEPLNLRSYSRITIVNFAFTQLVHLTLLIGMNLSGSVLTG